MLYFMIYRKLLIGSHNYVKQAVVQEVSLSTPVVLSHTQKCEHVEILYRIILSNYMLQKPLLKEQYIFMEAM